MSDNYLLDFKDPQELSEVVGMIREAAEIHAGFLGNCDVALAMEDVADNIESAHARLWEPTIGDEAVLAPLDEALSHDVA